MNIDILTQSFSNTKLISDKQTLQNIFFTLFVLTNFRNLNPRYILHRIFRRLKKFDSIEVFPVNPEVETFIRKNIPQSNIPPSEPLENIYHLLRTHDFNSPGLSVFSSLYDIPEILTPYDTTLLEYHLLEFREYITPLRNKINK
jgi:hypothetical protein